MELKSTSSFQDVDIDAMLEYTTFDDFMRGMYMSKVAEQPDTPNAKPLGNDVDNLMRQVFTFSKEMDGGGELKLDFE